MSLVRNLGLSGVDLDVPAGSVQVAAMFFVVMTYLILTVQESVEDHVFMQDEGSWHSIWVVFNAFTSAVATVLFMPVRPFAIVLSSAFHFYMQSMQEPMFCRVPVWRHTS